MRCLKYVLITTLLTSYSFSMDDLEQGFIDLKQKPVKASLYFDRESMPQNHQKTEISFGDDISRNITILKDIVLQNIFYSIDLGGKEINFNDLRELVEISNFLYKMNLFETSLDNEGMGIIANFTNLRKLEISNNLFDDEGMQYLSPLENLTELRLAYNKITSEGIRNLLPLKNLEELDISCTYLGNEGIEVLSHIESLKKLTIRACGFDDQALPYLNSMRNLQIVDISSNKKLTKEALVKFEEGNKSKGLKIIL